ncbi:polysaccharide export protein [Methylobacterium sp. 4-46]|uniref:polysaccharide biosynthesis/export family protein n=1 Tax=unclassified Methylobacterium TaxID=2615210 RepID=UPI000152E032|nr:MULTISPECIES: polysaccharide biosynthesis/export family protein [Methylobacterium]ACA15602.1 polysaccharide export protein [Methylobacterium sp. 4-46]WFT81314.1 polysaccharide biosynthesis/export family protein [Methylobacterium nodulans]
MVNQAPRRPSRTRAGLVLGAVLALAAHPAAAAYLIAPGDTLTIEAVAVPELKAKSVVNGDGEVTVPLVGQVPVAGLSLAEARAKIQSLLPSKEIRRRTDDGREFPLILSASEINVAILEYRPVYLNGDVAKPGEQPYRPGMTVRQTVALAGGFDILRFKMDNPFLQLSDLRDAYNTAWIDYAKEQQRLSRLRAELDGKGELDRKAVIETPVAPSVAKELSEGERAILTTRNEDIVKEKRYLTEAAAKENERASVLSEQERREKEGVQSDTDDLKRYQELFDRGNVPMPRLVEARRTVLLSATRALQTMAVLASVEREKGDLGRKLQRVDDTRRLEVLREIQDSTAKLAAIRSRLQAVSEKLRYTGMVKSQLVRGFDSQPQISIFRRSGGKTARIPADHDTELQPGDVVEVALQAEEPPEVPTR